MKRCPRCETPKPVDYFPRNAGRSDGRGVWCSECVNHYHREYNQRPEVKERARKRALAAYHALPDETKLRYNRGASKKATRLKLVYRKSWDWYAKTLADQGDRCAICEAPAYTSRLMSVDHDHKCCPTMKSCGSCVRGLLCVGCNVKLHALETGDWRVKAEAYLNRFGRGER